MTSRKTPGQLLLTFNAAKSLGAETLSVVRPETALRPFSCLECSLLFLGPVPTRYGPLISRFGANS